MISMCEKIRKALEAAGIDTYAPGQHKGDCIEPFVIIKNDGQSEIIGTASKRNTIDIIIYAPIAWYSKVDIFVADVQAALKQVRGLCDTYYQSPVLPDDDKNAYTTSLRYERYLPKK